MNDLSDHFDRLDIDTASFFYNYLVCHKGQKLLFLLIVINGQFLNIELILINLLLIQGHVGNCFLTSAFAFMYRTISDALVTRLFVILQWFMANLIKLLTPSQESSSVFLRYTVTQCIILYWWLYASVMIPVLYLYSTWCWDS